jgi:hypothetical protein
MLAKLKIIEGMPWETFCDPRETRGLSAPFQASYLLQASYSSFPSMSDNPTFTRPNEAAFPVNHA